MKVTRIKKITTKKKGLITPFSLLLIRFSWFLREIIFPLKPPVASHFTTDKKSWQEGVHHELRVVRTMKSGS